MEAVIDFLKEHLVKVLRFREWIVEAPTTGHSLVRVLLIWALLLALMAAYCVKLGLGVDDYLVGLGGGALLGASLMVMVFRWVAAARHQLAVQASDPSVDIRAVDVRVSATYEGAFRLRMTLVNRGPATWRVTRAVLTDGRLHPQGGSLLREVYDRGAENGERGVLRPGGTCQVVFEGRLDGCEVEPETDWTNFMAGRPGVHGGEAGFIGVHRLATDGSWVPGPVVEIRELVWGDHLSAPVYITRHLH